MRTNKKERQFPILIAYEHKRTKFLTVWCPYCAAFHYHGTGEGHRIAHCININSPFKQTGYYLKIGSTIDQEIVQGINKEQAPTPSHLY